MNSTIIVIAMICVVLSLPIIASLIEDSRKRKERIKRYYRYLNKP